MAHRNVLFPRKAAQGMNFSPLFSTVIVQAGGGRETRNQEWSRGLDVYDIECVLRDKPTIAEMLAFLRAVSMGSAYSFDFRNPADLSCGIDLSDGSDDPHTFGTGDSSETEFQLTKTYSYGGYDSIRPIQRPVDPVRIFKDGIELEETTDFTVDYSTGIVTFLATPATNADLAWIGEFYTPVRWQDDRVNMSLEGANSATLQGTLIEVRI